jgi:hypothetical protein
VVESNIRMAEFKVAVVEACGEHGLSNLEYLTALSELQQDRNAKMLHTERWSEDGS